jgi:hypothetical protein
MSALQKPVQKRRDGDERKDQKYQFHFFLAVLADSLNALAVGAPGAPGLRIFSPEPALMRSRLAAMLA